VSDKTAEVPLMMRVKWLAIGVIAGAALVYGLRPAANVTVGPAPVISGPSAERPTSSTLTSVVKATPPLSVDDTGAEPVAVIDGHPITIRQVEDTLLKKEGVEQLVSMLDESLKQTNWATLRDHDILAQINSWRVTRISVAAQLIKEKAEAAREDLIGITLVQNALAKEGVKIDEVLIANELKRMEKRHLAAQEARKQPYVEFRTMIEHEEKMPLEQYLAQPGFRMGAGVRVLVERRAKAQLTEDQLKEWFAKHIEQYRMQEAVDISSIYIPFDRITGADGNDKPATQDERDAKMGNMISFHQSIFQNKMTFEKIFRLFKAYDQHATADGRLGWVNRDGSRPIKGSRRVAKDAMDAAFAAQPPYPQLLSPVISDSGIDLIKVHARRAGQEPVFADMKSQLISDIVDRELPARTKRVLDELRRAAVIEYCSLPPLIERRSAAAGLSASQLNETPTP
jgi:hypothetical protein